MCLDTWVQPLPYPTSQCWSPNPGIHRCQASLPSPVTPPAQITNTLLLSELLWAGCPSRERVPCFCVAVALGCGNGKSTFISTESEPRQPRCMTCSSLIPLADCIPFPARYHARCRGQSWERSGEEFCLWALILVWREQALR